jgi:hypothetical protein
MISRRVAATLTSLIAACCPPVSVRGPALLELDGPGMRIRAELEEGGAFESGPRGALPDGAAPAAE